MASDPSGEWKPIVFSGPPNMSRNNGVNRRHFGAPARTARFYSAGMEKRPGPAVRLLHALVVLLLAWLAGVLPAQAEAGTALDQQVRDLALQGARGGTANRRFEVVVGQLDPRLKLAPCDKVEPYLPTGATLWGRTRVALRCTAGPTRWNVYLPVTVKVFAPALVAASLLPAGAVLGAADLKIAEVDLADEASPALADPALPVGRVLAQPLKPGQSLRESHLKPRIWFAAGESVQVVSAGSGFSVLVEGQAITPGVEGQPARVRHESGRVLTGRPVGQNRMELGP